MKRFSIFTIALLGLLLFACKKSDKVPQLTLSTVVDGRDVATNDSLLIEGVATDDDGLHEFYLLVTNTAGDTQLYKAPYVHNTKTYNFKFYFAPQDTGYYTGLIEVIDHDMNKVTRQFDLHASLPPVITLTAPADSANITLSDSLYIAGSASHNIRLQNLLLLVVSYNTGDTAFVQNTDISTLQNYSFSTYFHPLDTGNYYLQARVTNYQNQPAVASRRFHVGP